MLNDDQKKKIQDIAIGQNVDSKISTEDQIAAIRKQLVAICKVLKIDLDSDFALLENIVEDAKKPKETKEEKKVKKVVHKYEQP